MATQLGLGTAVIIGLTLFHAAGLIFLAGSLTRISARLNSTRKYFRSVTLLSFAVLAIVGIHAAEGWIWAAIYMAIGEFSDLAESLYFSIVTATTLGYGDLTLSEHWRLLATFEAMGGLILFGASTAFLMELLRNLFFSGSEKHS